MLVDEKKIIEKEGTGMHLNQKLEQLLDRKQPFSFEQINEDRLEKGLLPYQTSEMLSLVSLLKKKYPINISYKQIGNQITTYYHILEREIENDK